MSALYAEFKRVSNTRVSRERDGRRGRELLTLLAAVLPVAAALLAYTGLRLQTVQTGYRIAARRQEVIALTQEERQLQLRLAADTTPGESARFAEQQKFGPAHPGQIFYVSPENTAK